jgi:hypothetical protein
MSRMISERRAFHWPPVVKTQRRARWEYMAISLSQGRRCRTSSTHTHVVAFALELELIQTHMTQNSLLWVGVGVHAVSKRPGRDGVVWASAVVAWS